MDLCIVLQGARGHLPAANDNRIVRQQAVA